MAVNNIQVTTLEGSATGSGTPNSSGGSADFTSVASNAVSAPNTTGTGSNNNNPNTQSPAVLTFPDNIRSQYHFVKFSSFQYDREVRGKGPKNGGYSGHVVLPLPPNLMANYGANWGASEFSPVQSELMDQEFMSNFGREVRNSGPVNAVGVYGQKIWEGIQRNI